VSIDDITDCISELTVSAFVIGVERSEFLLDLRKSHDIIVITAINDGLVNGCEHISQDIVPPIARFETSFLC
jgi:hypothetical protein